MSLNQVGYCLASLGKFAEALPWYERAVAASEKGDIHGRVDQESVIVSLQSGATCLRKAGRSREAKEWEAKARALS
ncbi:MAG: tetratricopeptide repeat protein [Chloroflexi bacterium]|nr:tetratricopeptide repeat protein [Chloroflexota bacterium]